MRIDRPLRALRWEHPEPDRLVSLLAGLGLPVEAHRGRPRVGLRNVELDIAAAHEQRLLVRAPAKLEAAQGYVDTAVPQLLAVAVSSVDAPRTIRELAPAEFERGADDEALGARAWLDRASDPRLIVLEPRTEGRLAASLARHGEGPVALYVARPRLRSPDARALEGLERPRRWPDGDAARLVRPDTPFGPFLLLVEDPSDGDAAATRPRSG